MAHQQVIPRRAGVSPRTEHGSWPILTSWPVARPQPDTRRLQPVACCHISTGKGYGCRQRRDARWLRLQLFTALSSPGLLAMGNVITSGPYFRRQLRRGDPRPFTEHHFWQALRQRATSNGGRRAELPGDDLAMLTSLICRGLPAIRSGITVVEDINEHPVPRSTYCFGLLHSGVLAAQKAVMPAASPTARATMTRDTICRRLTLYCAGALPLIGGLRFGHEQRGDPAAGRPRAPVRRRPPGDRRPSVLTK
ncbi:hypothetical protein MJ579_18160 [Klebsiella pneumoniae]|nr:hypothetical protein MJ579_18160 [Klebsiella pneumoniae]